MGSLPSRPPPAALHGDARSRYRRGPSIRPVARRVLTSRAWPPRASLRRYAKNSAVSGDSSSATQYWAGQTEDHLPERKPRNRLFARAVDYRTYRLHIIGRGYLTPSQHDKLIDTKKQVEGAMSTEKFAGRNHILVLKFLYSFNSACDDCSVSEDQAVRLLKHFLVGSLQSISLSKLGVVFDGSRRGIDSIFSYPDAIY